MQNANGGGYLNNTVSKFNLIYNKIINACKNFWEEYSYLIKPFIILCIIYLVALLPLILANFNYVDDLQRVHRGNPDFQFFSRWIAEFGSIVLHTSKYISDISPISQLLAIIALATSSCIIIHLFSNNKKRVYINMIATLPLGLSPYFINCFSYKYDSVFMALSILFMIFPFIFIKRNMWKAYITSTILGTIAMCMSYQASSGIYPIIVIFLAFLWWREGKELKKIIRLIIISFISYTVGIFIFKSFIMTPVNHYSGTSIWSLSQIISGSIHNITTYFQYILSDFRSIWLLLIGIITVLFIFFSTWKTKKNKILTFVFSVVTVILTYILSYGLYIFLQQPLFLPRAMYGFGGIIALLAIQSCEIEKGHFTKIICVILSWCFIVYAASYGNILSEQQRYTDFRINIVISDLNELEVMNADNKKTLKISGTIGKSPVIENMPKYGVLLRTLPDTFGGNGWYWSSYYFLHYFNIPNITDKWNEPLEDMELPVLKDTMYHKISGNDEYILIELK